ncbi:hypothetical protein GCM10010123_43270 [Pilimelia anulata]|uniref:Uncharacterized protein n=1 Tax=Pilimelia anulata TaxID=53371 RepID=A0A8J3BGF5_9ACTN|nr:hypothetical protein [Pilimelia anulata]GGK08749.1 hypothetical protein GCM10010123_43270 [Pilimelia anulata]
MRAESTSVLDAPARPAAPAAVPARPGHRWWRLLPGALLVAAAAAVLYRYGVDPATQARFGGYLAGVVLLPGVLVWRALRGGSAGLPADLVGGAATGYALTIGAYLPGRAAGFPYGPVVLAAAVVVLFAAAPRLRRHWRTDAPPTRPAWAWSVAGLAAAVLGWAAVAYFRPHPLTWPGNADPYPDMVFHQALAGELRHHLPAQFPHIAGEPLRYHWFVHAEWAAASWASGVEPYLLTYRLGLLPAALLLVVAVAAVAQRAAAARWWAGPLAAALALFAVAPDPAGWSGTALPPAHLLRTMWPSPTQTFGGLLFAAAILVLVDLLRGSRRGPGPWLLFTLLVAGATGGKATYAPLLVAGLLTVAAVAALGRRLDRPALAAAAVTAAVFGVVQATMFRGTSGGLFVEPLASLRTTLPAAGGSRPVALAIWVLCWAALVVAAAVLARRRRWADPLLPLSAGLGLAALAVVLGFYQMGGSQLYFLQSARPYAALLVAAALAALLPAGRARWLWLPAAAAGAALTAAADRLTPDRPAAGWAILAAYAVPAAAALLVAGGLAAARRTRPAAGFAALALLVGAAVPTSAAYAAVQLSPAGTAVWARPSPPPAARVVPAGADAAGRWLRAHTPTDTVLASNQHCRPPQRRRSVCDPRQFWLAAAAQRRVLVEGWVFTPPANAYASAHRLSSDEIPYWDPPKLAANDAAYTTPTPFTVGLLRDRYGVGWLVVDTRRPHDAAALAAVAPRRFAAGDVAIHEVPAASAAVSVG